MATEVLVVRTQTSYTLVSEASTVQVLRGGGPQGPAGTDGASLQFVFNQGAPASVWTVVHTLNKFPSVTVVDSAGTTIIGQVVYDSISQVTLTFTAPFSGKAYLN